MKNRSATTEQWISNHADTFEFASIAVADIDFKKSQSVQNRSAVKVNDEHVLNIMLWLEDQAHTVDPIVVNKVGARYFIADGNHRAKAYAEAGRATIDAYVVEVDQDRFELMVLSANARNALHLSERERIELAVQMQRRTGSTQVAAAEFCMSPETLSREMRIMSGRHKVEEALGVKADAWPKKKLESLNRLDRDQIKALGRDVVEASAATDIQQSVDNILNVDALVRHEQATRESGRLEQVRQDKKKPKANTASRGMTSNKARTAVLQVTAYLRANPAAFNSGELMAALSDLTEVVNSGSARNAA